MITNQLVEQNAPYIQVTLAKIKGSAPQTLGATIYIASDGQFYGTIGGGKLETYVKEKSKEIFLKEKAECFLEEINLQKDIGMSCGGVVTLFFQPQNLDIFKIKIFGAGHLCQSLSRVLLNLNCLITIYDQRIEWTNKLPTASKHNLKIENRPFCGHHIIASDYILIMTQGYSSDLIILETLAKLNLKFSMIGVIGSIAKANKLKHALKEKMIPTEFIEQVFCPLGLPISNNTPNEIAISITSQILKIKNKKNLKTI